MALKKRINNLIHKLSASRNKEYSDFKKNCYYPAGHYYSPIVSVDDIKARESEIWDKGGTDGINGIDLQTEDQIELVASFKRYYAGIPFSDRKKAGTRYYFDNDFYSYTDGIMLYSMMRHFNPKRIIEIGSGFSSALMLDTNELFFNGEIKLTFIEPYPERLFSLLNDKDKKAATIIQSNVQTTPLENFSALEAGDILFVDSSHVVKTGSDVNYILFEILPILQRGVLIHFHDVFYPFEYPKAWVLMGRNWNEDYFLKAFLTNNDQFRIKLFSQYLHSHHKDVFKDMPLTYTTPGGNLWLAKR